MTDAIDSMRAALREAKADAERAKEERNRLSNEYHAIAKLRAERDDYHRKGLDLADHRDRLKDEVAQWKERAEKAEKELAALRGIVEIADQWDRAATYEDQQAHLARLHSALRKSRHG